MLTFGSLFSGIGGLDLGLERAGMKCVWQSEIEPYACKVLAKHWPDIPNLGDIREIDWSTVPRTDVICGGYPCQPFSLAGDLKVTHDEKYLWPEFARAISVVRPRHALLENVANHLAAGFGHVLADLAALGYDAEWDCIPAAAVGAPHLRDRLFVIATRSDWAEQRRFVADADDARSYDTIFTRWDAARHGRQDYWRHWQSEPDVGRVANGISYRLDRLRGLGNAVVPQVAEHVARIIINMEETQ